MKKFISFFSILTLALVVLLPRPTQASTWQAEAPAGYTPITWVKARGVSSFVKIPSTGGYVDYLTFIYLPYNQIKIFSSSTVPRVAWGGGQAPFDTMLSAQNWAVPKFLAERAKQENPDLQFMWNAPFFNSTISPTDLSLALKSVDAQGSFVSSGSRPTDDVVQNRKMLLINNQASMAQITDFDSTLFATSSTDQGVESFAASVTSKGTSSDVARLFVGVRSGGKELVIYCSNGASPQEASAALITAGVPVENQIQMDGGLSTTCAYNLPGQYFVEPGRNLPYLMGAFPAYPQGTITLESINVRNGAGTSNKIVDRLKKGMVVKIYEEKNSWYRIDQTEQKWVTGQYVKKM